MCGIAGVFKFSHRVTVDDVSAVLRMLDAQVHRGPDDWGLLVPSTVRREPQILSLLERLDPDHVRTYPAVASGPAVVLGARRLSIIDRSSRGRMPMETSDARQWVALNGEIYNFRELRTELGASPAFRSNTDTETLLRGWTAWGDGVVERDERHVLVGRAAVAAEAPHDAAVLDGRERRLLVRIVAEDLVHDAAVDDVPRMHRGVHPQPLHALQLRRIRLVEVREHPAQVLDGVDLVDRLDLIEKRVDGVRQLGMNVQRHESNFAPTTVA